MSYKDFEFLRRKEFLLLCILLILITFTQIALEISSDRAKTLVQVTTFLENDHIGLELLGLLLPILIATFFFIKHQSKKAFIGFSSKEYLIIIGLLFFFILFFPFQELVEEDEAPETIPGNTTLPTSVPSSTTSATPPPKPNDDPNLPEYTPIDTTLLNNLLNVFRNTLIFLILILPILIILLIQRKSEWEDDSSEEPVEMVREEDLEKQYSIRSILECYYQASAVLEEKGADDSPSFTPLEFSEDVINKELSEPSNINDLTVIFEEAKFSSHIMSFYQVEKAKTLASKIIFTHQITDRINDSDFDIHSEKSSKALEDDKKGHIDNE